MNTPKKIKALPVIEVLSLLLGLEAVVHRCSVKRCSKKFLKIHWKSPKQNLLFNKVCSVEPCKFIKKETSVQLFFCKFGENFKSAFFTEHFLTTTSKGSGPGYSTVRFTNGFTELKWKKLAYQNIESDSWQVLWRIIL